MVKALFREMLLFVCFFRAIVGTYPNTADIKKRIEDDDDEDNK
jgi:hypothetical protein